MLDIGYFIRALDIRLRYRFSQQKKKNLWIESVTHNYCGLSDMDMNWHMNNARYLREADFSRFALLGETGLWDAIKIRRKKEPQTSLLVTFTGLFAPNIATVAVTANKNNSQGLVPTSCSTTQTNGINTASEQHGNNHLIVIGNMLFTTTT
ncbi:unnamed protein product [Rotaria sp. Silwood1]|nr:unnamed protein product [Rotaria sp. Silwood1]